MLQVWHSIPVVVAHGPETRSNVQLFSSLAYKQAASKGIQSVEMKPTRISGAETSHLVDLRLIYKAHLTRRLQKELDMMCSLATIGNHLSCDGTRMGLAAGCISTALQQIRTKGRKANLKYCTHHLNTRSRVEQRIDADTTWRAWLDEGHMGENDACRSRHRWQEA